VPDISFPNLGIELYNVSRTAFSVFGVSIYWYALMLTGGIFAGYGTALIEAKRTKQKTDDYSELFFFGVIASIIGSRLFYAAFRWENFSDNPLRIITGIRDGGLSVFGGILGGIIAAYTISRVRKMDFVTILDTCAPSFAIGQAIGRWGNFFNREAFGSFTDNLFAMRIAQGAEYIQVHPTFFYESMWSLAAFAALTAYRPHKRFTGEVFWLYLVSYGFVRFFIEILRTDPLLLGTLQVSQAMAFIFFVSGIAVIALQRRRLRQNVK